MGVINVTEERIREIVREEIAAIREREQRQVLEGVARKLTRNIAVTALGSCSGS